MKRGFCLALVLCAITSTVSSAQNHRLPRDTQKLIERAQAFWTAIVAGHRIEAVAFVAPDKKDLFLSGSPIPVLRAEVVGLNLTDHPDQAQVRTSIETLAKEAIGSRSGWEITDLWVWRQGNWYLDLRDAPESIFPHTNTAPKTEISDTAKKIDKNFQILRNPVDLGRLIQGQQLTFEIPISYSGDVPVSAESELANPLADLDADSSNHITSATTQLVLLVNTEGWEGPFDLPLPIRIRNGAAAVKRTLVIRGTVFAPIAFRRDPPDGPIEPSQPFSLFVRNNTSQEATVFRIRTDSKFEILKAPETLPPNAEAEIVLKLNPDESPDRLFLELGAPLEGRGLYTYRFPSVPR